MAHAPATGYDAGFWVRNGGGRDRVHIEDVLHAEEARRVAVLSDGALWEGDARCFLQGPRVCLRDGPHRRHKPVRVRAGCVTEVPVQQRLAELPREGVPGDLDADLGIPVPAHGPVVDVRRAHECNVVVGYDRLGVQEHTVEGRAWASHVGRGGHRVGQEEERKVVPPVASEALGLPVILHGLLEAVGAPQVWIERAGFCPKGGDHGHGKLLAQPARALDAVQQDFADPVGGTAVQHGLSADVAVLASPGRGREVCGEILILDVDEALRLADYPHVLLVALPQRRGGAHPVPVPGQDHAARLRWRRVSRPPAYPVGPPPRPQLVPVGKLRGGPAPDPRLEVRPLHVELHPVRYLLVQCAEPFNAHFNVPASVGHLDTLGLAHLQARALDRRAEHLHLVADVVAPRPLLDCEVERPEMPRLRVLGALVLLPEAAGERVAHPHDRLRDSIQRARGLRPEVALRLAVRPPPLNKDHGNMLSGRTVHLHHHILPRLLVPCHVVLINVLLHEARVWPDVLGRVQPILREVHATHEGNLAVKRVRLDVWEVVQGRDEPPPRIEHQVEVPVVLASCNKQLLERCILVESYHLLRGRVLPAQDPHVHAAPDGLQHQVLEGGVGGRALPGAEDLQLGADEEGHDDDLALRGPELRVDLSEEGHPTDDGRGVARHIFEGNAAEPPCSN
mmetsp:Transcript_102948/g.291572  ORF Transcript_102948/g.291572 Transcript_102948/m.291572 type:complete len:678 (+) Transcript_102948:337-2370(+)